MTMSTITVRFLLGLHLALMIYQGQMSMCRADSMEDELYIVPPRPESQPYPLLLNERDVIHYVDANKQFEMVGSGSFANVTLGELRESGLPVVIKKFKSTSFIEFFHEVRVHRYLEKLGFSPRFIGLLPTGGMSQNISLVYEYVQFSKTLLDWFNEDGAFSTVQWLQICVDLASHLLQLHQHGVLFNDLHRKNVLVQKVNDKVKTYIIDYGLSTYRTGKLYKHGRESLEGYGYLAPELVNYTYTSEAADVYALGYILEKAGEKVSSPSLQNLAHWCLAEDPNDRPTLPEVITKLERMLGDTKSQCGCKDKTSTNCLVVTTIRHDVTERDSNASHAIRVRPTNVKRKEDVDATAKQAEAVGDAVGVKVSPTIVHRGDHMSCKTAFPVLNAKDFVDGPKTFITPVAEGVRDALRLAALSHDNRTVVVKEFFGVDFGAIRQEACVTMYLAGMGVAPGVLGLTIEYRDLTDIAFVQDYFGRGVTLKEFVTNTRNIEWDVRALRKAAVKKIGHVRSKRQALCRANKKTILLSLLSDLTRPTCRAKSYRQRILERTCNALASHLRSTHDAGILINNVRSKNALVGWNEAKLNDTVRDVDTVLDLRLIDFSMASSVSRGLVHVARPLIGSQRHAYLAPEVTAGHRTSVDSDVYSACVVIWSVLEDYFSIDDLVVEIHRYRLRRHQAGVGSLMDASSPDRSQTNATWNTKKKFRKRNFSSPYTSLQRLLLKCLHSSHGLRPTFHDIIQSLQQVSGYHSDMMWL